MTLSDKPKAEEIEEEPTYMFECKVVNVVDGDTIDVCVDLGFEVNHTVRVRLRDINTREISFVMHDSEEYKRGMVHKEFTENFVSEDMIMYSMEYDRGRYGRVIGDIWNNKQWLSRALFREFDDVSIYE